MTIKKKSKTLIVDKSDSQIQEFIEKGGGLPKECISVKKEKTFTLRLPLKLVAAIDQDRQKCIGKFSRNNWIIEAIHEKLTVK